MKMEYNVEIVETLSRTIAVNADNAAEAESKAREKYSNSEVVLSGDAYVSADFIVKGCE